MRSFNDHFSTLAESYARFRPGYPPELFDYLATAAPSLETALDCATGSGQAAVQLARHFHTVVATDASTKQLASAVRHERVEYRVSPAEQISLEDATVDLITVAQALHWFDLVGFYGEVRRLLKPEGVIAVWSYNLFTVAPAIDELVNEIYERVVGPYWPPERRHVANGYRDLAFPFDEIEVPAFAMTASWDFGRLLGYLRTWSATKRYQEATGRDPVEQFQRGLAAAWGEPQRKRPVRWPLTVRCGRVPAADSWASPW